MNKLTKNFFFILLISSLAQNAQAGTVLENQQSSTSLTNSVTNLDCQNNSDDRSSGGDNSGGSQSDRTRVKIRSLR